ncbi:voltage-gated potassium channel [Sanghuangporus baumii]|uniref:Voltage-gated potassium channel n=1 Tax=Sanghuangporus baumii TaxID=108892 RepID=A0A9Q5HXP3_SANBA|nr:voltage-gated potassium channel [Sanghuangporus baumii]
MNTTAFELQTFPDDHPYTGIHDVSSVSSSPPLSSIHPPWKRFLHELLEYPSASSASFLVHILTTSLILFSALVTVCETIPTFRATSPSIWFGIESSLVVLFTVEYIARALAWSVSWSVFGRWALSFFGIVDFLAIAPYYIELFLGVDTSVMFRFSILRTFRLLRVFRAFRSNNTITLTIEVMYLSVNRSQHALLALGFFLVMFLVIFSTILYFIDRTRKRDLGPDPTDLYRRRRGAKFVLVTITTVGYGDLTPRSFLGRLLTVPLLVFGLLLIALPSFVLGREFSKLWDAHARDSARVLTQESEQHEHEMEEPGKAALARQITDLQGALDTQAQMLSRLLKATENVSASRPSRSSRAPDSIRRYAEVLFDAEDEDIGSKSGNMRNDGQLAVRNLRLKDKEESKKGKRRADHHDDTKTSFCIFYA